MLIVANLIFISTISDIDVKKVLASFAPIVLFGFYIIYIAEVIRNLTPGSRTWWQVLKGAVGFAVVMLVLLALSTLILRQSFRNVEIDIQGSEENNRMMSRNNDSTLNMKKSLRTEDSFDSNKNNPTPVFVAYLDNFLEGENGEEIPNPLYFTTYQLPKFDTYTETFEQDSLAPYDDLFKPDPSKIPLYFTETDSSVIEKGMSYSFRKVVTADVYKVQLSPNEFTAPTTAFFCQPIAVDKDYKTEFKSAYRAQMYVSELNSAYFVYPSRKTEIQLFQMQRFEVLSQAEDFSVLPKDFYDYYTEMPQGLYFDSIQSLADNITKNAPTAADKILAIRDFFMAKDTYGDPIFTYSENPGIPGIPSGSKLAHFLFESHTGYCAHYAGAALFLLRSCGIPARVTIGFASVDRSTINPGWYWFYEDQAHAWVQVFFPEYGWLDFDFTMGNEEQQEAPTADGTPPLQPQKAYFAGRGAVNAVDTVSKQVLFNLNRMIYHDKEYKLDREVTLTLDMKVASIEKDSLRLKLSQVEVGDSALAISAAEIFRNIPPEIGQTGNEIVALFPRLIPVDELHIDGENDKENESFFNNNRQDKPLSITQLAGILLAIVGLFAICLLVIPCVKYRYYKRKAKNGKSLEVRTFYSYRTAMFLLNQLGCKRYDLTPLEYARQRVDPVYETNFTDFMVVYLKMKYSGAVLNEREQQHVESFYNDFEQKVKAKHKLGYRFRKFLNFYAALNDFRE